MKFLQRSPGLQGASTVLLRNPSHLATKKRRKWLKNRTTLCGSICFWMKCEKFSERIPFRMESRETPMCSKLLLDSPTNKDFRRRNLKFQHSLLPEPFRKT